MFKVTFIYALQEWPMSDCPTKEDFEVMKATDHSIINKRNITFD
jgi:hypothetical protein